MHREILESAKFPEIVFTPTQVKGAAAAIEFYQKAFGAVETLRLAEPDGRIGHAEIQIDGETLHLARYGTRGAHYSRMPPPEEWVPET